MSKFPKTITNLFQEVSAKGIEFIPLKLASELFLKTKSLDTDLHFVFINYTSLENEEFQTYISTNPILPYTFAQKFCSILQRLPSQIQLIYDMINPQLRYSIAFQLSNMKNKTRTYNELISYMKFINDFFINISNTTLLDNILKALFNVPLIEILQPRILGFALNPSAARTSIQYISLFLEYITSKPLANMLSHFLFGFHGRLLYHPIKDASYKSMEINDSSMDIQPESKSLCDINPIDGSADGTYTSTSVGLKNLLEEDQNSVSLLGDESNKEDLKDTSMIKKSDSFPFPEELTLSKYLLNKHDPKIITEFFITSMGCEKGGYSNIVLQVIDKLLSFGIKDVYDLFIFDGIEINVKNYKRKTAQEIIKSFPNYTKLLFNLRKNLPVSLNYGIDMLISDYVTYKNETKNNSKNIKRSRSCCNYKINPLPMDESLFKNKSQSILLVNPHPKEIELLIGDENPDDIIIQNPFIDQLVKKFDKFLNNTLDENLFLTSIIIKLFLVPIDLNNKSSIALDCFLFNNSEYSIINLIKKTINEIMNSTQIFPKLPEMIARRKEAQKKLVTSVTAQAKGENMKIERFLDVIYIQYRQSYYLVNS